MNVNSAHLNCHLVPESLTFECVDLDTLLNGSDKVNACSMSGGYEIEGVAGTALMNAFMRLALCCCVLMAVIKLSYIKPTNNVACEIIVL